MLRHKLIVRQLGIRAADSLDLVELIMAFEEEFDGEISDEEAQQITTVGQVVAYINEHMRG